MFERFFRPHRLYVEHADEVMSEGGLRPEDEGGRERLLGDSGIRRNIVRFNDDKRRKGERKKIDVAGAQIVDALLRRIDRAEISRRLGYRRHLPIDALGNPRRFHNARKHVQKHFFRFGIILSRFAQKRYGAPYGIGRCVFR